MDVFNNSTTSNNTWYNSDMINFYNRALKVSLVFDVFIIMAIIISNIFLLVTILTSSKLKTELRYMVISSLAFCDLLVGVFGVPIFADFTLQKKLTVSCYVHVAVQVLLVYSHVMITNVGLLIINIDYIIKQYDYKMPHFNLAYKRPFNILMSLLPWIVMFIVVPPIIKTGLHDYVGRLWTDTFCPLILQKWATITSAILCSYLPFLILMATSGIIIYGFVAQKRGNMAFRPSLLNDEIPLLHPKFFIIANLVGATLVLPEQWVHNGLFIMNLKMHLIAIIGTFLLAMSKSFLMPIIWLLTPEVNEAFKERCSLSYWRRSPDLPQSLVNKTYKEFAKEGGNVE